MQLGFSIFISGPFITMVLSSTFTVKNVRVSDSWLQDTKCLLSGKSAASLGYSPLMGRQKSLSSFPSGIILNKVTEFSPALEATIYLKSSEILRALAAVPEE